MIKNEEKKTINGGQFALNMTHHILGRYGVKF